MYRAAKIFPAALSSSPHQQREQTRGEIYNRPRERFVETSASATKRRKLTPFIWDPAVMGNCARGQWLQIENAAHQVQGKPPPPLYVHARPQRVICMCLVEWYACVVVVYVAGAQRERERTDTHGRKWNGSRFSAGEMRVNAALRGTHHSNDPERSAAIYFCSLPGALECVVFEKLNFFLFQHTFCFK